MLGRRELCSHSKCGSGLTAEQSDAVAQLYRTTHNVRRRTRAQMVLLAAEQHLEVGEIVAIVPGGVEIFTKIAGEHRSRVLSIRSRWARWSS